MPTFKVTRGLGLFVTLVGGCSGSSGGTQTTPQQPPMTTQQIRLTGGSVAQRSMVEKAVGDVDSLWNDTHFWELVSERPAWLAGVDEAPISGQTLVQRLRPLSPKTVPYRIGRLGAAKFCFLGHCAHSRTNASTARCGTISINGPNITSPELLVNTIAHECTHVLGTGDGPIGCDGSSSQYVFTDGGYSDDTLPWLVSYSFGDLAQCYYEASRGTTNAEERKRKARTCFDRRINGRDGADRMWHACCERTGNRFVRQARKESGECALDSNGNSAMCSDRSRGESSRETFKAAQNDLVTGAESQLIEDDIFAFAESKERVPRYSTGIPSIAAKSLDVDLVISLIRDHAQQAGVRALVDVLAEHSKSAGTAYIADLLSATTKMLMDPAGLTESRVEELSMVVIRALLASAAVRMVFPNATTLKDPKQWTEVGYANPEVSNLEATALRIYLTDRAYAELSKIGPFSRRDTSAAHCPIDWVKDDKVRKSLCEDLGSEALESIFQLRTFTESLALAAGIADKVDIASFVRALRKRDGVLASFSGNALLAPNKLQPLLTQLEDRASGVTEINVKKGSMYAAYAALQALLGPGNGTVPTIKDIKEAAEKLSAMYATACIAAPVLKNENIESWLANLKATGTGSDLPAARLFWTTNGPLDGISGSLSSISNALKDGRAAIRILQTLPSELNDFHIADINRLSPTLVTLGQTAKSLRTAFTSLGITDASFMNPLSLVDNEVARLQELVKLLVGVGPDVFGSERLGPTFAKLLVLGEGGDQVFEILLPMLAQLQSRKQLDRNAAVRIIASLPAGRIAEALFDKQPDTLCAAKGNAKCWALRVIESFQSALDVDSTRVKMDGEKVLRSVVAYGDDFRQTVSGRAFFHLTVGTGQLWVPVPPSGGAKLGPLVAEQIGFGYALPSFWKNRLTLKGGLYGSGILYRLVMNSAESNAVIFGSFAAVDIYNLLELHVSPSLVVYPSMGDTTIAPRFGLSFGLQVPLGDYLSGH